MANDARFNSQLTLIPYGNRVMRVLLGVWSGKKMMS